MTERLRFHFSVSCIGEGHGNPLQCSCLENPRDGGAWWGAVCGVTQSRTWLKRLSSSSSHIKKPHKKWVKLIYNSNKFYSAQHISKVLSFQHKINVKKLLMRYFTFLFLISLQNPVYMLHLQHISIWMLSITGIPDLYSDFIKFTGKILDLHTHTSCSK